jgi:DNA (cytosine-5)-methyltransferase 1
MLSPTLRAGNSHTSVLDNSLKIRKLTPLECWRLMGFDDEDYWSAREALEKKYYNGRDRSNSQMYKMAGNSIVVNVLEEIYKKLFKDYM